jgi:hypothetical protein
VITPIPNALAVTLHEDENDRFWAPDVPIVSLPTPVDDSLTRAR